MPVSSMSAVERIARVIAGQQLSATRMASIHPHHRRSIWNGNPMLMMPTPYCGRYESRMPRWLLLAIPRSGSA